MVRKGGWVGISSSFLLVSLLHWGDLFIPDV